MTEKILHLGDMDSKFPQDIAYDFEGEEYDAILFSGDTTRNLISRGNGRPKINKKALDKMNYTFGFLNAVAEEENVPVFAIPGNHDGTGEWRHESVNRNIYREMVGEFENINDLEFETARINDQDVVGGGFFFEPERFAYKDEVPNPALCEVDSADYGDSLRDVQEYADDILADITEQLEEMDELGISNGYLEDTKARLEKKRGNYSAKKGKFDELIEETEDPVLLHHGVPNFKDEGSTIDLIQNKNAPSDVRGKHYGSIVGREVLEDNQVAAYLGGHIHEGQGHSELYDTPVFNAGSGGVYEIEIENGNVVDFKLHKAN